MSDKLDPHLRGHGTSTRKMITTRATGHVSTVHIMQTEGFDVIRILNVREDGGKCEIMATESELRAAYKALELYFAAVDSWKRDLKP